MTATDTVAAPDGDMAANASDWRTIAEAAAALGKSERTIRRYIDQGRLEADKSTTPYHVNMAALGGDLSDMHRQHGGGAGTTPAGEIEELKAQVAALEADNEDLRAKVDRLATENAQLGAEARGLQNLVDQIRSERDYLRQANAAALSKIPGPKPSIWQRLLPWGRGEDEG